MKFCVALATGLVSLQLNMGEGKTRVILPMVALELCGKGDVVRLNFLSQLLPEALSYLSVCLTGTNRYPGALSADDISSSSVCY
jgi:hypothetical protein